ncbi:MAG: hypothetical protein ACREE6_04110 [Limisphaerales bacterium]
MFASVGEMMQLGTRTGIDADGIPAFFARADFAAGTDHSGRAADCVSAPGLQLMAERFLCDLAAAAATGIDRAAWPTHSSGQTLTDAVSLALEKNTTSRPDQPQHRDNNRRTIGHALERSQEISRPKSPKIFRAARFLFYSSLVLGLVHPFFNL